ncbi:hypothetical protein IE81DRAFT_229243 [Ceraceosorus guamensis]|uniref:Uncharacterized protein n=1 Tax=Ceraceosorus guamensis TaxID=1522189 RepID=A0A316W5H2_9BASI|nr:hypothetical protein IE81DRAFT_229243 [Ceraceosorus guamensis]PWN45089.1 hypothetical protein IE81DRAFT_229243 [Ceraceosorus guamensis]
MASALMLEPKLRHQPPVHPFHAPQFHRLISLVLSECVHHSCEVVASLCRYAAATPTAPQRAAGRFQALNGGVRDYSIPPLHTPPQRRESQRRLRDNAAYSSKHSKPPLLQNTHGSPCAHDASGLLGTNFTYRSTPLPHPLGVVLLFSHCTSHSFRITARAQYAVLIRY